MNEENDEIDNFIILEKQISSETKKLEEQKTAPSILERINKVKESNNKYEQAMSNGKKYERLIEELKNETNYENKWRTSSSHK